MFKHKHKINQRLNSLSGKYNVSFLNLSIYINFRNTLHHTIMEANDVNRSEIQEQIKVQGEIVRKLKTEKADKDKVGTSSSDFLGNLKHMC